MNNVLLTAGVACLILAARSARSAFDRLLADNRAQIAGMRTALPKKISILQPDVLT